ncbi:MAG: histidine kinase N-terminal 7TM domain-containing diguanylate cyclase [Chloroflexota bacterium]
MPFKVDLFSILLFVSALLSFAAAITAWRQRARPSALPMAILGVVTGVWALCAYFEHISTDLASKLLWSRLKYTAFTVMPVALSSFVLRFSGWNKWPGKQLLAVLLVIPVATALILFTNEYHHLFWHSHELVAHSSFTELRSDYGPWYWVNIFYAYGLILSSIVTAISLLARTWGVYRNQAITLAIGIGLPITVGMLTLLSTHPWTGRDVSPIAFGVATFFLLMTTRLRSIANVVLLAHANLVEQMRDGVLVLDKEKHILEVNGAAEQILSITKPALLGNTLSALHHPVLETITSALTGKTIRHEIEIGKDDSSNWYDVRISAIRSDSDEIAGYIAIWHNITDQKKIESELRYNASHDPLTGIYNRMYYDEAIERIINESRWPVSIISIDLDNLKKTNDVLGHAAGDELIRSTATLLRNAFRQDDLVARIGGDEFAVLAMQTDESRVEILIQRLHEMVEQHNAEAPRVPIEFSIGHSVAYYRDEFRMALIDADNRMYANKNQRKAGRSAVR